MRTLNSLCTLLLALNTISEAIKKVEVEISNDVLKISRLRVFSFLDVTLFNRCFIFKKTKEKYPKHLYKPHCSQTSKEKCMLFQDVYYSSIRGNPSPVALTSLGFLIFFNRIIIWNRQQNTHTKDLVWHVPFFPSCPMSWATRRP